MPVENEHVLHLYKMHHGHGALSGCNVIPVKDDPKTLRQEATGDEYTYKHGSQEEQGDCALPLESCNRNLFAQHGSDGLCDLFLRQRFHDVGFDARV